LLIAYVSLVGLLVWVMGRWERALQIPGFARPPDREANRDMRDEKRDAIRR